MAKQHEHQSLVIMLILAFMLWFWLILYGKGG